MITETVILAGGRGTRLAPLTDTIPKPLLPIQGIPTLSHILRSVEKLGIGRVTLSLGYRAEDIMKRYGSIFRTLRLNYAVENTPLGTAGAVKATILPSGPATDVYGDPLPRDGTILVLSGDALFEGDLAALVEAHHRCRADVTIAAKELEDVSGYGVITGKPSRIDGFVEKPDPDKTPSHIVNLGIYLLSERVLAEIPSGSYDFGKDLFPALLRKGYTLAYRLFDDYWCDIGSHKSYLEANLRHSQGKTVVGNRCELAETASLEGSLLLDNVKVGADCIIDSSILAEGVTIAPGVALSHSVVGHDCQIEVSPPEGSLITKEDGKLSITPLSSPLPAFVF